MFSKLGIFSLFAGFFVWLLGALSGFIKGETDLTDLTLSSISEEIAASAVDAFSSQTVQKMLYTIFYDVHLGVILAGIGLVFIVISMFIKEY